MQLTQKVMNMKIISIYLMGLILLSFPFNLQANISGDIENNNDTFLKPLIPVLEGYAELTNRVDGGYYNVYQVDGLKFHYLCEYYIAESSEHKYLNYKVYNESREVVLDNSIELEVNYGHNYYEVDCSGFLSTGKRYLLEVTTLKGKKLYLKFKYINYIP